KKSKPSKVRLLLSPKEVERYNSLAQGLVDEVRAKRRTVRSFGSLDSCPKCECDAQSRRLDTYSYQPKVYLSNTIEQEDTEGWPPGVVLSWSTGHMGTLKYMASGFEEEVLVVTCSGCGFRLGNEWPADHVESA
ncbi:hypothetical protein, partial [Rhodococcus sp. UNC363MFTsu5.1]|uniref:hypothetical protein n=1 Tax=Rhodococcus sp. UNC363MFTsu5.1 TaxID=1449069 RepID=UPI00055DB205